jgi:diadenosine tetraphosphate (Ap4A) HIT family hydrolase
MNLIKNTPKDSIIFEDSKVIVALAHESLTKGHTVVIWKNETEDLSMLGAEDYKYLMGIVDVTRNTLINFYNVEKVYLMYLDECNWVHWHLIPRYNEKGFNILNHKPLVTNDFIDVEKLTSMFKKIGHNNK